MSNDANLLFAMLAIQLDLIKSDQLIQAANQWMLDKQTPIADILVSNGALSKEDRDFVDLVFKKLTSRTGSVEKSIDSISHSSLTTFDSGRGGKLPNDLSDLAEELSQRTRQHDPTTQAFRLREGRKITDQFRILRSLARGGLGAVSVALDASLEREVAIKEILPRNASNPDAQARFLAEARVTGALEHPGIVPVYVLGEFPDSRPFYVMRLIRGQSLEEALRRFHATPQSRTEYIRNLRPLVRHLIDACNAIAYAHNRGVLHRDIKPMNIMLGKFGETLVVDWGLAKPINSLQTDHFMSEMPIGSGSSDFTPTEFGSVVGTPGYMSPEQAAGRLDLLGRQADVFSLGATLYCILIGRSPFHTIDRAETLRRARTNEYEPPRRVNPNVPVELNAIVAKALAMEPHDRFDDALELADELERWMAGEPVKSYPEPFFRRAVRFTKQYQPYVISSILLLTLLSLGLVFLNQAISNERDIADLARKRAEQSSKTSAEIIDEFVKGLADSKWSQMPGMDEERLKMLDTACDRLTEEMKLAPDDMELQKRSVMVFVRAAGANRTLSRLDRASDLFGRIMPLVNQGKPTELSDDDIATYTDALSVYTSILSATQGASVALEKSQRNLELSEERFRRHPETASQIGLVRALVDRSGLLIDLGETAKVRDAMAKARESQTRVFDDAFRQQNVFALDFMDFRIEWSLLQCDMLDRAWQDALRQFAVVESKLASMRQHERLNRDSNNFEGRLLKFKARILRELNRSDDALVAIDAALRRLEQNDAEFPSNASKRAIIEATVEKGLQYAVVDIPVAHKLLEAAKQKLLASSEGSSAIQILPLEIQIARLELTIAEASDGTISTIAAQQTLDAAKAKLMAIEPKSVWLR